MKIFLFSLIIAFFVFKIEFWSNAYSNYIKFVTTDFDKKYLLVNARKFFNFGKNYEVS